MGWPNCTRTLVYDTVSASAAAAAPTCSALSAMQAASLTWFRATLPPMRRATAPSSRTTLSRRD